MQLHSCTFSPINIIIKKVFTFQFLKMWRHLHLKHYFLVEMVNYSCLICLIVCLSVCQYVYVHSTKLCSINCVLFMEHYHTCDFRCMCANRGVFVGVCVCVCVCICIDWLSSAYSSVQITKYEKSNKHDNIHKSQT